MLKFVLEKPDRFSWPLWIGVLSVGGLAVAGLAALGLVLALILVSFGLAVFLIVGLVNIVRQSLDSWRPSQDDGPNGQGEDMLMDVEEIVTVPYMHPQSEAREDSDRD